MIAANRILAPCLLCVSILGLTACNLKTALSGGSTSAGTAPSRPAEADVPIPAGRFEVRVLTADWCGYCKQVPALLEKLRVEFPNVRFREFDIDAAGNGKLVTAYAPEAYPFFVLLDGGKIIDRARGLQDYDRYSAHLRKKFAAATAGGL